MLTSLKQFQMIIETEQLCKSFGSVIAVENLSLSIPEGSAFALVGTNGAGKTTTMRTILNIFRPDSGVAKVLGVDSKKLEYKHFNRIGYVSENQRLPEKLTVRQFFKYLSRLYLGWDAKLEANLIKRFELPIERPLGKLSHGMRMKAVLIAGIAFHPELLILDEPLSGMDTLTRDEVVEGLLDRASETTIVISSHEISEIENFTSHVAFMDKGYLHFQDSIDTLKSRFREVEVKLSNEKSMPSVMPSSWLLPEIVGHQFSFVDSEYQDTEVTQELLRKHFGAIHISIEPMSLREISNTLIKSNRANVSRMGHV